MIVLRRLQSIVERELKTATGERRADLDVVRERTESALSAASLVFSRRFAEAAAAQARTDLDHLSHLV